MRRIDGSQLAALSDDLAVPFILDLSDGAMSGQWWVSRVLRVLPERRLVVQAVAVEPDSDGSSPGLAEAGRILKLFVGAERERYCERERRGLGWLDEAGLPVARVLDQIQTRAVTGLVIDYLNEAEVVSATDQGAVERVATLLARMHEAGLWQEDLHLKNFMVSPDGVHAIDGDGVRRRANAVPPGAGLADLALLAAQRPPSMDDLAPVLLSTYCSTRGWKKPPAEGEFRQKLDHARRGRMRRYLKKTFRDCTEFAVVRDESRLYFSARGPGERVLESIRSAGILARGEALLAAETVKLGNSATLVRTEATVPVVIKRYNIKNFSQGLRRMLRPTPRFRRAWMMGRLLNFLDLPTAKPLALIEERRRILSFLPFLSFLPDVAYLVMEDLGERDLATEVAESGLSDARCLELTELFALLKRAGLTHGDTKATNFLIHHDRVHLIDLDAMRMGLSGFDHDLERFLDNWAAEERRQFETAFQQAGLL